MGHILYNLSFIITNKAKKINKLIWAPLKRNWGKLKPMLHKTLLKVKNGRRIELFSNSIIIHPEN